MEKDFQNWNKLKIQLNARPDTPIFQARQVWWCHTGINVGHEQDGKGKPFTRPVLIVRKFNRHIFLGAPLTTKIKDMRDYHRIRFKGQEECVMLLQLRTWAARRLQRPIGKLPEDQFEEVKKAIARMLWE